MKIAHTVSTVCLLVLAGLLAWNPAVRAGVVDDFRTEAGALRQDVTALDETWHRMLGQLPVKDGGIDAIDLNMPGAVAGKDLFIRIYRVAGTPVRVMAWAPKWNDAEHTVEPSLQVVGDASTLSVTGTMHVALEFDGWEPMDGQATEVWYELNGKMQQGGIKGTFATFVPPAPKNEPQLQKKSGVAAAKGEFTGVLTRVQGKPQRPAGLPSLRTRNWNTYQAYSCSRTALRQAERLYQATRAIAIALDNGIPYADALEYVPAPRPFYEDYDPPKAARAKKLAKTNAAPSLDDIDTDLGGGGASAGAPAEANPDTDPATPGALKALRTMRSRAATQLRLVKAYEESAKRPSAKSLMTPRDPGDPMFHPWYETRQPLTVKDKVHLLPATAGADGIQNWAPIQQWRLLGPFAVAELPLYARQNHGDPIPTNIAWYAVTPGLPALIAGLTEKFLTDPFIGPGGRPIWRNTSIIEWQSIEPFSSFGGTAPKYVASRNPYYGPKAVPPGYTIPAAHGVTGMDMASYLGEAEIQAEADVELWAGFGGFARGMLWLNDELLWGGPADWRKSWAPLGMAHGPEHSPEFTAIVRLPFRKGLNRLRVSTEAGFGGQYFWVRLCTLGKPGDPAAVGARETAVAKAREDLPPAMGGVGFRGDFTGVFDAKPPVAWHLKTRRNIAWYTPLPFWSNAAPIPSGDRLFVMVERDRLFCLSKADGRILWEKPCSAIDSLPEALRKEGNDLYERWWAAQKKRNAIPPDVLPMDPWIARGHTYYWTESEVVAPVKAAANVPPELAALQKKREELEAAPDPVAVQAELEKVLEQIEKLSAKTLEADPVKAAARATQAECGNAHRELIGFLAKHFGISGLDGYWQDIDGYQFSTPITDGKNLWVKSGFGALTCFDMDGNKKYVVRHGGLGAGSRTIPSPILVDGKIVMVLSRASGAGKPPHWETVAFDAGTGKELWATPCRAMGWGACSPTVLRLTNGRESMAVIVTGAGNVIRADDGRMLAESIGGMSDSGGLACHDDVVVFTGTPPMTAVRLMMIDRDTLGFRPLWRRGLSAQYHTAVLADGVVFFSAHPNGITRGPGESWLGFGRVRAADGKVLETVPAMRKGCNPWSIESASRDHIFFYSAEDMFNGAANKMPGSMAVLERGVDGAVVAVNGIERTFSSPTMEGDRMYLHGYHGVWCVAYTGDEGRKYEARHVAETLLDQIPLQRPKAVEPIDGGEPRQSVAGARTIMDNGQAPGSWHLAGPFAAGTQTALRQECADPKVWAQYGTQASGSDWKLVRMNKANIPGNEARPWIVCRENFTLIERQLRRVVDFTRVVKTQPGQVYYLYAEYDNPNERVVRFEMNEPGAKAWLNDKPVADGRRLRLKKGTAVLIMELTFDKEAPMGSFTVSPRFWDSDDPAAEEQEWLRFVNKHRALLQTAIERVPDSVEGKAAARVLGQL